MMPLATEAGKILNAKRVNGNWREVNRMGGMTNRNLREQIIELLR